ncbi:MAG: MGMT family protein [Candidatus Omnitrophica bacterium]|nr:MGMT family protein [Candidatus Omnitrophota bacterium]
MKKRRGILSVILKNKNLSDFEKAVYKALLKIPKGEVRSYKWAACAVGRPKAARAVGNALNKNPYPVVVPCHRVICSDGSIGGFARGLKAKRRLLAKEGVDCFKARCYNQ